MPKDKDSFLISYYFGAVALVIYRIIFQYMNNFSVLVHITAILYFCISKLNKTE